MDLYRAKHLGVAYATLNAVAAANEAARASGAAYVRALGDAADCAAHAFTRYCEGDPAIANKAALQAFNLAKQARFEGYADDLLDLAIYDAAVAVLALTLPTPRDRAELLALAAVACGFPRP